MADDGKDLKIEWAQSEGANWVREEHKSGMAMSGAAGEIKAGLGGIPLEEIVIEKQSKSEDESGLKPCSVAAAGLVQVADTAQSTLLRLPTTAEDSCTHATFSAAEPGVGFRRVALRFGRHTPPVFNIGPYTSAQAEMEDPSDYLDFTEAEYREMARSPEAAKLKRHAKIKSVIGHADDEETAPDSTWAARGPSTRAKAASAAAPIPCSARAGNRQRHGNALQIRLGDATTTAEVELYSGGDTSLRVQLAPETKPAPLPAGVAMKLDVKADKQWHEVALRVEGTRLSAKLDRAPLKEASFRRGDGDRVFLKILGGSVDFDDVEFIVQRESSKGVLYAFNQPEPDWIREPADNWWTTAASPACSPQADSLVAPDSKTMMWNKRTFSSNALVTFNIEENSEWYGWDKYPNHTHFPFDHVKPSSPPKGPHH